MKTYEDAVKLLTSQKKFRIELGLDRIENILEFLGNPQDKLKCIHVAGTNGKGSVCTIIATILAKAGIKTGLYTSPHIFDYTERIRILDSEGQAGRLVKAAKQLSSQAAKLEIEEISREQLADKTYSPIRLFAYSPDKDLSPYSHIALSPSNISKSDFTNYIFSICNLADKNNINLTEFEILTSVMFKYFADNNIEVVVLETGLGGRFDATNVIKSNLCSIITHIDLDHTERLGNTKSEIAFEKAGIIKPDCPVFTCEGYEEIKDKADECNSLLTLVAPFEDTKNLSLKGTCQKENLSLALSAVRYLFPQISEETIQEALKEVKHPCRFQAIKPDLIVDGSHNPNGAAALRESLDLYYPNKERCFIFGCLKNKDYNKMMEVLFSKGDEIYFYHFKHSNSCTIEELRNACKFPSKEFKSLDELPKDKLKIVCGSFYMLNEIIPSELALQ
ncbi:bifunctional folylpolyglutamate synthase/dihydrofolate synthase [bacterium]|nr:bifunctional folylpolyglutamate synthase/dihydrofolate synthase [bacterium]